MDSKGHGFFATLRMTKAEMEIATSLMLLAMTPFDRLTSWFTLKFTMNG
jgi:hypothetical protein